MKNLKEYWKQSRTEILESVTKIKQIDLDNKITIKRKKKGIYATLGIGVLYLILGIIGLIFQSQIPNDIVQVVIVVCIELIVIGIYALLYVLIFYCEQSIRKRNSEDKIKLLIQGLQEVFLIIISLYYWCVNIIKRFIQDKKQVHIAIFYPYYLISLIITLVLFGFSIIFLSNIERYGIYREGIGLVIAFILFAIYWNLGKLFTYISNKSLVKSVYKSEIKNSKINHEDEKAIIKKKIDNAWKEIEKELEFTKIYFYILLTLVLLCIPQSAGDNVGLLVTQSMGLITIAALGREVQGKMEIEKESDRKNSSYDILACSMDDKSDNKKIDVRTKNKLLYTDLDKELDKKLSKLVSKKNIFKLLKTSKYDINIFVEGKRIIEQYYNENDFSLEHMQSRKYYLLTKSTSYYSLSMPVILSVVASYFSILLLNDTNYSLLSSIFVAIKNYSGQIHSVSKEFVMKYIAIGIEILILLTFTLFILAGIIMVLLWVSRIIGRHGIEYRAYEREFLKLYEVEYIDKLCEKI